MAEHLPALKRLKPTIDINILVEWIIPQFDCIMTNPGIGDNTLSELWRHTVS